MPGATLPAAHALATRLETLAYGEAASKEDYLKTLTSKLQDSAFIQRTDDEC